MNLIRYFQGAILYCLAAGHAFALDASSSNKVNAYREIKTSYEQFLGGQPSKAARLDYMRTIVRESQLGTARADRLYHNFEGRYSIDPRIPGVEKTVILTQSSNPNQAKGYRRELLYAVSIHNDPNFSLEAMNKPLKRPWGNTDADIVFRNKSTGLYGRIEVKDYSLNSQTTNLKKLKIQIDKMAKEARYTGQPQVWINRREVHDEVLKYAKSKGVFVLDRVSTGQSPNAKTISSTEAWGRVDREIIRVNRTRTAVASGQLAFGAWMLADSMPNAWEDYQAALNPDTESTQAWLRFGESGSKAFAGGAMTASGGSALASKFAGAELQGSLYRYGRVGGVTALAALGASEVFAIARYRNGDVSSRDFWTTQYVMGTSASGGAVGGWIGTISGALVTKNPYLTTLAGTTGGTVGAGVGDIVGRKTSEIYYEWKFAKLDEAFGKFVYRCYGIENGDGHCL